VAEKTGVGNAVLISTVTALVVLVSEQLLNEQFAAGGGATRSIGRAFDSIYDWASGRPVLLVLLLLLLPALRAIWFIVETILNNVRDRWDSPYLELGGASQRYFNSWLTLWAFGGATTWVGLANESAGLTTAGLALALIGAFRFGQGVRDIFG
jgi:hypothetical protein